MSKKLTTRCTGDVVTGDVVTGDVVTGDVGMSSLTSTTSSSSKKRSREEEGESDTLHKDKKLKSEILQESNTVPLLEEAPPRNLIPMWYVKYNLIDLTTKWIEETTHGWIFGCPVDPKALCSCRPSPCHCVLKEYFNIVLSPMDLGTIKQKLERNQYDQINEYIADVKLTFMNAILFNKDLNDIPVIASKYWNVFNGVMRKLYKVHFDAYEQYCFSIYQKNNCKRSAVISAIQYQQQLYELNQFLNSFFTEADLREFEKSPEAVAYEIVIQS